MDSPIEKITDPSFTSSAKGLMTLFCIGLIHVVIGVDLEDVKIAIPWLPTVTFEHPERLLYLYWAMVGYALYRYTLHHKAIFGKYYFESLAKVLEVGQKGESLVRDSIYLSDFYYHVDCSYKDESYRVEIETMVDEDTAFDFSFHFSKDYSFRKIECWENPAYDVNELVTNHESIKSKWGFITYADESGYCTNETSKIVDMRLRYRLRFLVLRYYFKEMTFNKDIFDTTVPIALNVFLFIYWLGNSIYQHYSAMA